MPTPSTVITLLGVVHLAPLLGILLAVRLLKAGTTPTMAKALLGLAVLALFWPSLFYLTMHDHSHIPNSVRETIFWGPTLGFVAFATLMACTAILKHRMIWLGTASLLTNALCAYLVCVLLTLEW